MTAILFGIAIAFAAFVAILLFQMPVKPQSEEPQGDLLTNWLTGEPHCEGWWDVSTDDAGTSPFRAYWNGQAWQSNVNGYWIGYHPGVIRCYRGLAQPSEVAA